MGPVVVSRPVLSIQNNFNEVLREHDGQVWVACKIPGQQNCYGLLKNCGMSGEGIPFIQSSDKFKIQQITHRSIKVVHEDPNCQTLFIAPTLSFTTVHDKSVNSLDVSSGGLGVSVCSENNMKVWETGTGQTRRNLKGHIWDVYTCRLFPSGVVVLSAGADMLIKIWSAETGNCAATLKGHTAPVMDTCIVDRGRNIVSVSKDGTAKLWDCGTAKCLDTVTNAGPTVMNSCDLNNVEIDLGAKPDRSEREVSTDGKLLVIGCENGSVKGIGLHSRTQVFQLENAAAVNSCAFLSSTEFVYGTQNGELCLVDVRFPSEPKYIWRESASPVMSLLPFRNGFFSARYDGTSVFSTVDGDDTIILTGPDCDPIYKIVSDGRYLYTGCRDSEIRKYEIPRR